jgi:hypothetical protein
MIYEVASLPKKSRIRIIARETFGVIAFPDSQLSLCVGVDVGEGSIGR